MEIHGGRVRQGPCRLPQRPPHCHGVRGGSAPGGRAGGHLRRFACVAKSYPAFFSDLDSAGGQPHEHLRQALQDHHIRRIPRPVRGRPHRRLPRGLPLSEGDFLPDLERRKGGKAGHHSRGRKRIRPRSCPASSREPRPAPRCSSSSRTGTWTRPPTKSCGVSPGPARRTSSPSKSSAASTTTGAEAPSPGRLTAGLVAAGVVAKKLIRPVTVEARLLEAGRIG